MCPPRVLGKNMMNGGTHGNVHTKTCYHVPGEKYDAQNMLQGKSRRERNPHMTRQRKLLRMETPHTCNGPPSGFVVGCGLP